MAQWMRANTTPTETEEPYANFTEVMVNSTFPQVSDGTTAPWVWLPMEWTWWVILQLLFAMLGILGNLFVITVLFNRRSVRRSTDTLIGALAFADFLTSVFMIPFPQINSLPSDTWLAQVYCRIINPSVMMWIAVVASEYTLTAISLERLLAIAHPFSFIRNVNSTRISVCIVIIWVAAIATNSFVFVVGFAAENQCVFLYPSHNAQIAIGLFVFMSEFVIPVIIMLSAQIMTAIILHKQSLKFREEKRSNASMNHIIAKKRVIHMLFLVTTLFIICWGPEQIFFVLVNLGALDFGFLYGPLHRSLVILTFVNSCANIFIYTIRYPQFRETMWNMFRCDSILAPHFPASNKCKSVSTRGI